jgi:hypothetical protein
MSQKGYITSVFGDEDIVKSKVSGKILVYGLNPRRIKKAIDTSSPDSFIIIKADSAFSHIFISPPPYHFSIIRKILWVLKQKTIFKSNISDLKEVLNSNKVRKIWVESEATSLDLVKFCPNLSRKIYTLPQIAPDSEAEFLASKNKKTKIFSTFCYVGRMTDYRQKRADRLIVMGLLNRIFHSNLTITAAGPYTKTFKFLAKIANIQLLGPINYDGVKELMRNCDALLLLSDYEGAPNVIAEALAIGINVVMLPLRGIVEWRGDNSLIYFPSKFSIFSLFGELLKSELRSSSRSLPLDNNSIYRMLIE